MEPLLAIEHLSKVFGRRGLWPGRLRPGSHGRGRPSHARRAEVRAVDDLSFTVPRGALYGFLGPNGAGKSTTIRLALGLLHPTAGRVVIGGHCVAVERIRALRCVGGFVEAPSFYPHLSGRRNLEIFAALSGGVGRGELEAVLERVGLAARADDKLRVYSHGMRMRLGLAACLLPRPELLILDEPTDGLDPHGVREMRELIQRLNRQDGLTVFLSSHQLGEVEDLCTRVAILDRGRLILEGQLAELEQRYRRCRIETDRPLAAAAVLAQKLALAARPTEDGRALLVALNGAPPETVNAALLAAGLAVSALMPEPAWLDRLFRELTTSKEAARVPAAEERLG